MQHAVGIAFLSKSKGHESHYEIHSHMMYFDFLLFVSQSRQISQTGSNSYGIYLPH